MGAYLSEVVWWSGRTATFMIWGGVFERHPELRVATIECGSDWADSLVRKLKKAYGQMHTSFKQDPVEQLRRHVSIAPYYEDDIPLLRELIGTEQIGTEVDANGVVYVDLPLPVGR